MDKASDFGSEDCRFESCHGRENVFVIFCCTILNFIFSNDKYGHDNIVTEDSNNNKDMKIITKSKETSFQLLNTLNISG